MGRIKVFPFFPYLILVIFICKSTIWCQNEDYFDLLDDTTPNYYHPTYRWVSSTTFSFPFHLPGWSMVRKKKFSSRSLKIRNLSFNYPKLRLRIGLFIPAWDINKFTIIDFTIYTRLFLVKLKSIVDRTILHSKRIVDGSILHCKANVCVFSKI